LRIGTATLIWAYCLLMARSFSRKTSTISCQVITIHISSKSQSVQKASTNGFSTNMLTITIQSKPTTPWQWYKSKKLAVMTSNLMPRLFCCQLRASSSTWEAQTPWLTSHARSSTQLTIMDWIMTVLKTLLTWIGGDASCSWPLPQFLPINSPKCIKLTCKPRRLTGTL